MLFGVWICFKVKNGGCGYLGAKCWGKYQDLINKEYFFCLKIAEDLIKKANRLYDSQMTTGKFKKFCCDFKLLEQVCDTYVI